MTYLKTTWVNGSAPAISATNLNHIEDGIETLDTTTLKLAGGSLSGPVTTVSTINKLTLTQPASGAILTITDGKTLAATDNASVSGTNSGDNATNTQYSGLDAAKVNVNAPITPGTNTKITYDAKGLVTGGAAAILASADFANQGTTTTLLHGDASGNPAFGAVVTNDISNSQITYAKIQDVSATDKVLGRSSSGAGIVEEIACTAAGRALMGDPSANGQRIILGLGTIATQNANNVSISGGAITGITDLSVADGGTGTSTLTGYVVGSGVSALTAVATVPWSDIDKTVSDIANITTKSHTSLTDKGTNTHTDIDNHISGTGTSVHGLGTMALEASGNVNISGGVITGITDIVVADGGTGRSVTVAYTPICGGTTTTAAHQSVASLGNAGDVLTSNGAGALPTFQAGATWILVTKSTTWVASTETTILANANGGSFVITLPAAASNTNKLYNIKKIDSTANTVTVDGNGSETIDGSLTQVIAYQYDSVTIQCDGSNWYIL